MFTPQRIDAVLQAWHRINFVKKPSIKAQLLYVIPGNVKPDIPSIKEIYKEDYKKFLKCIKSDRFIFKKKDLNYLVIPRKQGEWSKAVHSIIPLGNIIVI